MNQASMSLGFYIFGRRGRDGEPVKRTRQSHPYTFDDYLLYETEAPALANDSLYTDHMYHQEPEKYERLLRKHISTTSNFWEGRSPEKIQAFLRDYCDEPDLELVRVWACCDQSSGADHWQFEFLSSSRPVPEGYAKPAVPKRTRKQAT